jgi:hypothetical protein
VNPYLTGVVDLVYTAGLYHRPVHGPCRLLPRGLLTQLKQGFHLYLGSRGHTLGEGASAHIGPEAESRWDFRTR